MKGNVFECKKCKKLFSNDEAVKRTRNNTKKTCCPHCFNDEILEKVKEITPFSNLIEFESWKHNNCYLCASYEDKSACEKNATCVLAFNIDLASVSTGTIKPIVAYKIGVRQRNLALLRKRCKEFNKFRK